MSRKNLSLVLGMLLTASVAWSAPNSATQYYNAGVKYYQEGNYDQAILYLKTAAGFDSKDWKTFQALGLAYYKNGDKSGAIENLDKSLALNPENPSLRTFTDKLRQTQPPAPPPPSEVPNGSIYKSPKAQPNGETGGVFGLGLEFGDPGTFGVSAKFWASKEFGIQPTLKIDGGTILQCDFLWHIDGLIPVPRGRLPLYIGAGAGLAFGGGAVAVEGRGVGGISYLFDRKDVPMDIYLQIVPALWFWSGGLSTLQVYADLGARWYF